MSIEFVCNHLPAFRGKRALVRVDFNIGIKDGELLDDARIVQSLPTINAIRQAGVKYILLITHIGRPKNNSNDQSLSVKNIIPNLKKYINDIVFIGDPSAHDLNQYENGEILIAENIRFYKEEEANHHEFSAALANLADLYVNDAFSVCHRGHASVVGVLKFIPGFAGMALQRELNMLSDLKEIDMSAVFGGAKLESKIKSINTILKTHNCKSILLGGVLCNSWLMAQGFQIGSSRVDISNNTVKSALQSIQNAQILDVVLHDKSTKNIRAIEPQDMIMDLGNETIKQFAISAGDVVLWNGPLGRYEDESFIKGSQYLYTLLMQYGKKIIIGGGDTLSCVKGLPCNGNVYKSTGGGALLDWIAENGSIPGTDALNNQ